MHGAPNVPQILEVARDWLQAPGPPRSSLRESQRRSRKTPREVPRRVGSGKRHSVHLLNALVDRRTVLVNPPELGRQTRTSSRRGPQKENLPDSGSSKACRSNDAVRRRRSRSSRFGRNMTSFRSGRNSVFQIVKIELNQVLQLWLHHIPVAGSCRNIAVGTNNRPSPSEFRCRRPAVPLSNAE